MTGDELARVLRADRAHLWHPYTPMDEFRRDHRPLVVASAQGPWLTLADGRRVMDGVGSWWVSTLGHNHPRLVRALREQAEQLCHVALAGITHAPAALLAEELANVAPSGLDQVYFSDDGSTAIEAAVKMAAQYHFQTAPRSGARKTRFVALDSAFHGETVGAASLGGVEIFRRPFGSVLFDCVHVPSPAVDSGSCAPGWAAAFDALAELLATDGERIAALVLEPLVQGAAGMRMYPPAYLRAARDLCTKHDVLLILDEVFTGYGRLGRMWASDLAEISPDITCVGKGFTAGVLPMAATLTRREILDGFSGGRRRAFLHGHSYCGNPLGAAVAREVLAIYREEQILAGIPERAGRVAAALDRLAAMAPGVVREVRCLGMIGVVELRAELVGAPPSSILPSTESEADVGSYTSQAGWTVAEQALQRGVYLRPLGNVVYVTPPLNIPLPDLDRLLQVVTDSVLSVA